MANVRIEYSEEQQWIRTDNYTHEANSNGFKTIIESVDEKQADDFCRVIEKMMYDSQSSLCAETVKQLYAHHNRFTKKSQYIIMPMKPIKE